MSESTPPSPQRVQKLVSSLVKNTSPKRQPSNPRISYERLAHDDSDNKDWVQIPLSGGEPTSPPRITMVVDSDATYPTFCIDDDSDEEDGNETSNRNSIFREPPELPSLDSNPVPPANYICPLTLQIMEDPVCDSCGHTFERRAIVEWLGRNNHNSDGDSRETAVCPISRKLLIPHGCIEIFRETDKHSREGFQNGTSDAASCYERVLKRNVGLQERIQKWKLEHPLYQGVDPNYAQQQRNRMLRRDTITPGINKSKAIGCPYGGETNDGEIRNSEKSVNQQHRHHRLSGFELLLLPQERDFLKELRQQALEERRKSNRSHNYILVLLLVLSILVLVGVFLTNNGMR